MLIVPVSVCSHVQVRVWYFSTLFPVCVFSGSVSVGFMFVSCLFAASANCSSTEFHCDNGRCVQQSWLCDGDDDCGDASDELCATSTCAPGEFECAAASGSCISMSWRCDGEIDCADASDEQGCDWSKCAEGEFRCGDGSCIVAAYRCDVQVDCADGSDEADCSNCTHASRDV